MESGSDSAQEESVVLSENTLEEDILGVKKEILSVGKLIAEVAHEISITSDPDEKKQLKEKEILLLVKEKGLREKEILLLVKEKGLREEKKQLQIEKRQLQTGKFSPLMVGVLIISRRQNIKCEILTGLAPPYTQQSF
jgi:hypothetical protein